MARVRASWARRCRRHPALLPTAWVAASLRRQGSGVTGERVRGAMGGRPQGNVGAVRRWGAAPRRPPGPRLAAAGGRHRPPHWTPHGPAMLNCPRAGPAGRSIREWARCVASASRCTPRLPRNLAQSRHRATLRACKWERAASGRKWHGPHLWRALGPSYCGSMTPLTSGLALGRAARAIGRRRAPCMGETLRRQATQAARLRCPLATIWNPHEIQPVSRSPPACRRPHASIASKVPLFSPCLRFAGPDPVPTRAY